MSAFIIEGGHLLKGDIVPQGAKNEALQVICATLLTSQKVRITKPSFTECVDAFKEWAEARSYEFTDLVSVERIY